MKDLCGRTATIVKIDNRKVELEDWSNNKNTSWNFSTDMLEPVVFKKCDLQDGDILTDRDGDKSLYSEGNLYGNTIDLDYLMDDLTANPACYSKYADIIKVERPIGFETVFEREEEVKEMTMEELCKHFGCQVKIVKEEE